jgi:hypothetical protein
MPEQNKMPTEKDYIDWAAYMFSSGRYKALWDKVSCQNTFKENDSQVRTVFIRLLQRLEIEYRSLGHDYSKNEYTSLSLLAWRARNLLELDAWSRFCCTNKNNAKAFFKEGAKDYLDLRENLQKWGEKTNQPLDWHKEQEAAKELAFLEARRLGINDLNSDIMTACKAAQKCGFGDAFKIHNKMLSKFVHPTAYYLFLHDDPAVLPKQAYDLVSKGCMYFYDAFYRLEEFIETNLEHKNVSQ